MNNAFAAKIAADEKFEAHEVTSELRDMATLWLFAYEGKFEFLVDMKAQSRKGPLTDGMVKGVLNSMLGDMKKRNVDGLEPGLYRLNDEIYRIQIGRQSKRKYAMRLIVITGNRLNDSTEAIEHFDFEYAPGAMKVLRIQDRMSLDEAKAFGIRYGMCCYCGKRLKDAKSVSLGIGPVCIKRVA